MADNNNALLGNLPKTPNPALKKLDRLIGKWKISGPDIDGYAIFEWMEGGFFLIQHFEHNYTGQKIKGIEYTGFDEDTQTLRSHLMDISGSNFTYTKDIEGDTSGTGSETKVRRISAAGRSARTETLLLAVGSGQKAMVRPVAMNIR